MPFNLFNLFPRRKPPEPADKPSAVTPADSATSVLKPADPTSVAQEEGAISEADAARILQQAARMINDPAYLAEQVGLASGDPHIPDIQAKLRAALAQMGAGQGSSAEDTLLVWLNTHSVRVARRYLEAHPELLSLEADAQLRRLESQYQTRAQPWLDARRPRLALAIIQREPIAADLWEALLAYGRIMDTVDMLSTQRLLLEDIRARLSTNRDATSAIRDAYVNAYGGWILDLPPWLEWVKRELDALQDSRYLTARVALLRWTLARVQGDNEVEPVILADLTGMLCEALSESVAGSADPAAVQDEAITLLHKLLVYYPSDRYPLRHAGIRNDLGEAYRSRISGDRRANQERAIEYFEFMPENVRRFPKLYATILHNLGEAYRNRIAEKQQEYLEKAIACYREALSIFTLERFPQFYASTLCNMGLALASQIGGKNQSHLQQAIECFELASIIHTEDRFPYEYARLQLNLGLAFFERAKGNHLMFTLMPDLADDQRSKEYTDDQEHAKKCLEAALAIYTVQEFPAEYALAESNLGAVYQYRIAGEKRTNQKFALACYEAALSIYTADRFPAEHRRTQWGRARLAMDAGEWELAHESLQGALAVEELLLALSGDVEARDTLLAETIGAAADDGYALLRLGQPEAAALAVERGRAHGLAESRQLWTADPARITNSERRARYVAARRTLAEAQNKLNAPITSVDLVNTAFNMAAFATLEPAARKATLEHFTRTVERQRSQVFNQAKSDFDATVAEVRIARDPEDFLLASLDLDTLVRAVARGGAGHALVYLGATNQGGMALGAFVANGSATAGVASQPRIVGLDLPLLTHRRLLDLIQRPLVPDDFQVRGSYNLAQQGAGFGTLLLQWPGRSLRESAQALRDDCQSVGVGETLEVATRRTISKLAAVGRADLADAPMATLSDSDQACIECTFNEIFLRLELHRSLAILADIAMRPLAEWLRKLGATSVTLIPCGELGIFPLAATEITSGETFGDRFSTSVAPSARSLLQDETRRNEARRRRAGVAALGDPRPTHQPLQWGEAEALTVARLARKYGLSAESRVGEKARRGWLLDRMTRVMVVDASCHGKFGRDDPLDSSLALAGAQGATEGERLYLRDLLNRGLAGGDEQALLGLRLLILSACETGILDFPNGLDEMRSMTAGVLEAGADAAMGALWSVDDKATYLLITRFAQYWLPNMETMPPAVALAKAQRWLRTVTNRELRQWRYDSVPEITAEERAEAGSAEPDRDPWRTETAAGVKGVRTATMRGAGERLDLENDDTDFVMDANGETRANRTQRYDPREAQYKVQDQAAHAGDDDVRTYVDPYFWAGFQITGW